MSDKPRRFWQIHLSTAVLICCTLSAFVWLNLDGGYSGGGPNADTYTCGFPMKAYLWQHYNEDGVVDISEWESLTESALTNSLMALSCTFNVAFISEYLIRRKSKPCWGIYNALDKLYRRSINLIGTKVSVLLGRISNS